MSAGELPPVAVVDAAALTFCDRPSCRREITKRDERYIASHGTYCSKQCLDEMGFVPKEALAAGHHRARMPAVPFADIAPHQSSSPTSTASAANQATTMRSKMFLIYELL